MLEILALLQAKSKHGGSESQFGPSKTLVVAQALGSFLCPKGWHQF